MTRLRRHGILRFKYRDHNSRKLSIRSLIVFHVQMDEVRDEEISYAMENEEDYEIRKENIEALQLVTAKKDTCRFKNEIIRHRISRIP